MNVNSHNKSLAIGFLSVTGLMLIIANLLPLQSPANAATAVIQRDYSLVTAASVAGGEAIYLVDNRTGMVAVFVWDVGRRGLVVRDVRPLSDAFE